MRASLAGIPIVTPDWIEKCSLEQKIVAPTADMFIRSLPTKSPNLLSDLALYGTALVAARLQQVASGAAPSSALPLKNVCVHLCGAFAARKSNLVLLLRESGATIQSSTAAAIKLSSSKKVVFLCDETISTDDLCGITSAQAGQIERAIADGHDGGPPLVVVNAQWLFDVVTCGRLIVPANLYEPSSARCKNLWLASQHYRK
jgi:hypothetical protein